MRRRKSTHFRPSVADALEDRVVPSSAGGSRAAAAHRAHAHASAQAIATARLGAAFQTFEQTFTDAVNVDLYTPMITGTGSAAVMFYEQLGQALNTLGQGALKALGHVPAGSPAVAQIRKQINGPGTDSLRNRLTALTRATLSYGSSLSAYEATAVEEIRQTYSRINKQVVAAVSGANGNGSGSTTSTPSTAQNPS